MSVVEASDRVFPLQCITARTAEKLYTYVHKTIRICLNVSSYLNSFLLLTPLRLISLHL